MRWPLDLERALSSTFGETRATSFHAGVDLKTWGKTGYEVHAVADGWVERLRASPWGYGRALYQRLDDGRIVVYAHLEGFFAPAAERVRVEQRRRRRYTVDMWLEEGEIPVSGGQVIALTGKSGAGPPHLHLEIRDAHSVPVNPLLEGLGPVADTTPPTLRRLLVTPLGPESTVDGGHVPVSVPLRWSDAAGRYEASRALSAWGRIGVAVDSHDRADAATNKMAALSHELRVDGRTVLTSRYARVSYSDIHQVALDRLRPGLQHGGVYAALYRRPGNRLSFYDTPDDGDGTLMCGPGGLGAGPHEIDVVAADAAGNHVLARLLLRVSAPPRIHWVRLQRTEGSLFLDADVTDPDGGRLTVEVLRSQDGERWEPEVRQEIASGGGPYTWALSSRPARLWRLSVSDGFGPAQIHDLSSPIDDASAPPLQLKPRLVARARHVLLEIESPRPLRGAPGVLLEAGAAEVAPSRQGVAIHVRQVGPWSYRAVLPLEETPGGALTITATAADGAQDTRRLLLDRHPMLPGEARILPYLDSRVQLRAAAGSAYETIYPQIHALTPEPSPGLRATALGCDLGPADATFDDHASIWLRVPRDQPIDRAGVYADDGEGRWVFLGSEREPDSRRVGARVRALGRFALMVDESAPEVSQVRPQAGEVTEPLVGCSARVADEGSGIGREEDVVLELDGVRLVSEYDPEADVVVAQPDTGLAPGAHRLVVTVRDQAGNETARTVDFRSR